jgi:hypothetical protein
VTGSPSKLGVTLHYFPNRYDFNVSICKSSGLISYVSSGSAETVGSERSFVPPAPTDLIERLRLTVQQIRCDKTSPCSSCQIAHLACGATSSGPPAESSPAAPPTAPVPQSTYTSSSEESHFNLIHASLTEIKERLERLEKTPKPSRHPFEIHAVATELNTPSVSSTVFQNEPSFNNQSAQASLSAEQSAEGSIITNCDQEIQSSLAFLKSRLQGQSLPPSVNSLSFPCSSPKSSSTDVELPPLPIVLAALRRASGKNCYLIRSLFLTDLSSETASCAFA